jgi:hypothetical protein
MTLEGEADSRLATELVPGERVMWRGSPEADRWFFRQDMVLVPFSLMWGGFAIFWETSVLLSRHARNSIVFAIWGVPFVIVGLYLIFGRLYARRRTRERTRYVLTDRRAIVLAPAWWGGGERSSSIWLGSYPPVERQRHRDGTGTLWIGPLAPGQRWLGGETAWPFMRMIGTSALTFADVPDVDRIYALIRGQLSAASSPTSQPQIQT